MRQDIQKVRRFSEILPRNPEILPRNFKILSQFLGISLWNHVGNAQHALPLTHQIANALRQNPRFKETLRQVYHR